MQFRMVVVLVLLLQPAVARGLDTVAEGRRMNELFRDAEIDELWNRFNEEMRDSMRGGKEQLRIFQLTTLSRLGEETRVLDEIVSDTDGFQVYVRMSEFSKYPGIMITQWAFDKGGRIGGFFIRPPTQEAPSDNLDYETLARLQLPIEGTWYVVWGGRLLADNYHAITLDQRFAMDILIKHDTRTHISQGEKNEDYHCWGKNILTPGNGVVAAMVDSVPDNVPGVMNPIHPLGNHVIVEHGQGEFSFLAHMQRGSVQVAVGDTVRTGDILGRCGNSGNSSEPHLHYHLQDTPFFQDGDGLPAQFLTYTADGVLVQRGEPRQDQRIAPFPGTD